MQVKYGLTAVGVSIDHNAVTIFGKPVLASDTGSRQEKMAKGKFVIRGCPIQRVDMLARDDKNMGRGLWTKVIECNARLVFENACRRNLAFRDLAENTVVQPHIDS